MTEHRRLDEVWNGEFARDGDILQRRLYQPDRPKVLEAIKTIRTEGIVEDRDWRGRWCLSIPLEDWERFRRHPRWKSLHASGEEGQRAMREFLSHPDSAIFRIRDRAS